MSWLGSSNQPKPLVVEPPPPPAVVEPEVFERDFTALVAENVGPISGQIGMGAVFGYCSGFALQKAGS
jgi:hypothetical protein